MFGGVKVRNCDNCVPREGSIWWLELGFRRIPAKLATHPPPFAVVWGLEVASTPPPPRPVPSRPPCVLAPKPGLQVLQHANHFLESPLAFVTRTPEKKHHQISLDGSAIATPLKTRYEGQPGDHSRVMHKFMSNSANVAQFMPQGIN
jgi:hypothetical protein